MTKQTEQTPSQQQWDETFNSPEGQALLEQLAEQAMKDIENGDFKELDKED